MDINKAEIAQYVVQMQNGDGPAFEKLYNATNQSGYFTALKILKDEDEAQDVLQDSYIKVLERIREIQNPESFVSWFHQIVANTAKNYLAKKKPSLFTSDEEEQDYAEFTPDEDEIWQPEKSVDEDEVRRQVMQIIDGLTDEKRTCVLLYYYNEMSVADIAKSVGASENTVKARLFQARKDIRKEVEKLGAKNITLRGVAPISLVLWALRMASKAEGAKFAAGPAAAAVMEGAAASAGVAATAASTTAAVTAGGGLAAKIAALTVAQKVIAGVAAAGVVAGAAAGTSAVVRHNKEKLEPEPTTEAVEAYAEMTTGDLLESLVTITDAEETTTEPNSEQHEAVTEPTATTAAPTTTGHEKTTGSAAAASASSAAAGSSAAQTTNAATNNTTATKPTTTKPTTTKPTTTKPTTTTTTTKPTTTTTTKPTTTTTTTTTQASVTPQTPVTTTTTTTTTTEKVKGTATVNVGYSVADYGDSGSVSFTVQEGDAITEDMVVNAVRGKLSGSYSIDDVILRSGSPVSSAEPTTYSYTVIVYVD